VAITLKDVALLCHVHPSTVSRVLRGKENLKVSDETRKKIFAAAQKLHYQPDQTARSLRLKKSNAIGLVIPNISSPYFSGIAKIIDIQCSNSGYTLVVCDTNEDQEKEIRAINDLCCRGIDGLIIAPVPECDHHIRELVEKKFPFVIIDRCFNDFKTNAVISNDEESAYQAVMHLAELGHRDIGFISGRANLYPVLKRLDGYKKAIRVYNLCNNPDYISGGTGSLESGYDSMQQLLALPKVPTAFLISGTIITLGAIKALIELGLMIPEDISIIGFTDTIYAPYLVCPLTTISHQVQKIGLESFNILFKQMASKHLVRLKQVVINMRFNDRNSTRKISQNLQKVEH
jgi:LacI family transcriptional regulator